MTQHTTQPLEQPPAAAAPVTTWQRPIRWLAAIIAVLVLVTGVVSVVGFFLTRNSTKTTRFQTANFSTPVTSLQVTVDTGDVVVRTGKASAGATVVSRITSGFRTPQHRETLSGGVLQVTSSCDGALVFFADSCSVDYEITVPAGTVVKARNSIGDVSVQGTGAAVTATSDTGDLRVSQVGSPLQLSTDVGDITGLALPGGTVDGRSSTGDIRLNFTTAPARIKATTDVGDVEVMVPNDATSYRVNTNVDVGGRRVHVPTDPASNRIVELRSSTGDIRMGSPNR